MNKQQSNLISQTSSHSLQFKESRAPEPITHFNRPLNKDKVKSKIAFLPLVISVYIKSLFCFFLLPLLSHYYFSSLYYYLADKNDKN